MAQTESWTIGRLLTWTADFLKQHGADSPRLDAEILLAHVRGCRRIELYTAFDEVASESLRASFRELVKRRSQGAPVAYLVGHREFYSLAFQVNSHVLIPRPETEFLVIEVLDLMKRGGERTSAWRIADVGTGSGIIAVCLAKSAANCQVTAIDISAAALDVARANVLDHHVDDRVQLLCGDLLETLPAESRFDVIVSNPPYVKESEFPQLARDVRDFEPRVALIAGPSGMEVFEPLVAQSATRLVPGGWLVIEIHPELEPDLRALFARRPGWSQVGVAKDLAGLPRVMKAQRQA